MAAWMQISAVLPILLAIFAYFYLAHRNKQEFLQRVLQGLLKEERSLNASKDLRIAVGFGSCMDLIVDAVPLFEKLRMKPPKQPLHHDSIENEKELAETFAYFMREGAAAERFIEAATFKKILEAARILPKVIWRAGGNAPIIGKRLSIEGANEVLIAANASNEYRSFFPGNVKFLDDADHQDDIHLILEFKVGDTWGNYTAPRANRFVIHSDVTNPKLRYVEPFGKALGMFKPHLVIVSALQMLDNFPFQADEREQRMEALQELLESIDKVPIHFEMASFAEKEMMKSLLKHVVPFVTSIGMNEQELPNLVSMLAHGDVVTVADANPRTAIVLDSMRALYSQMKEKSLRGLERIHVHTLAFQAILTRKSSRFKNNRASAAKAALVANRYICNKNKVDTSKARIVMDESFAVSVAVDSQRIPFKPDDPVSCWDENDYEICISPVLVCTDVYQTVGGGDNISPSGFLLHLS